MTEMVNGESQNFQNSAELPVTPSSTPNTPSEERNFSQNDVNDLVKRAKHEAVERYKRETSIASHQQPTYAQQREQQYYGQPQQQPQSPPPYNPQTEGMSRDEYRRLAAEEARRERTQWEEESRQRSEQQNAQRIAQEFFTKVSSGEGGMQAFEKLVNETGVDLQSIPYHVQLANMVDNTKEVIVEMLKNPTKLGQIQALIDIDLRAGRNPRLAFSEIQRLSKSLKENEQAANFKRPNEPLDQLKPSNAGAGNTGKLEVSDYKRKYRV